MVLLHDFGDVARAERDDIISRSPPKTCVENSRAAGRAHFLAESLRCIITVTCVNVRIGGLLTADVEVIAKQRRRIGAVGAAHCGDAPCTGFTSKMMTYFCGGGADVVGCVPGAKFGTVEPHPSRRDMKKRGHHDAGVRRPIDPFVLRQPRDALRYQPVIGPADKLQHGRQVGGGRNRIEQPNRRESRGNKTIGRSRCESQRVSPEDEFGIAVGHERPIDLVGLHVGAATRAVQKTADGEQTVLRTAGHESERRLPAEDDRIVRGP